jgi:hypothetical protein
MHVLCESRQPPLPAVASAVGILCISMLTPRPIIAKHFQPACDPQLGASSSMQRDGRENSGARGEVATRLEGV